MYASVGLPIDSFKFYILSKTADDNHKYLACSLKLTAQSRAKQYACSLQTDPKDMSEEETYTCLVYSQTHKPGKSLIHREERDDGGRDDGEIDENSIILPHTSPHTNME